MSKLDRHLSNLLRLTDVEWLTAIDVGCGQGALVRTLAALGASVTGVEISQDKVAAADARPKVADEHYCVGAGEDMPAGDGSADLITYLFSLHHVPIELQAAAVAEARRVLRPGGRLHVVDPLPEGPATDVLEVIEDERGVRIAAQTMMDQLDGHGWALVEKSRYTVEQRHRDLDAFIATTVLVDPMRAARLEGNRTALAERFANRAERHDGHFRLSQPCVLFHLIRSG